MKKLLQSPLFFLLFNYFFVLTASAQTYYISTIAGNGTAGYSGDGGVATSAELSGPFEVAVDASGNVYIVDSYNNCIRKVTTGTGIISTIAGNGTAGYAGDGGAATSAELNNPTGVAVDALGNVYIADFNNNRIRMVAAGTGIITTIAGNGTAGYSGDEGAATSAELNLNPPGEVAIDASGNVYIADAGNSRIRKVSASTGIISTIAGNGTVGYSGDGGAATSAELTYPDGVAIDASGNVYIADVENNVIRKVTAGTGIISTIAGNSTSGYSGDGGAASLAELNNPVGVAVDASGNVYIGDYENNVIRKVAVGTGIISTIAGNGTAGYSGDGGTATAAELNSPAGVAIDASGNVYIADQFSNRIRKLSPAITWIGSTSTDWNTTSNWSTGSVPSSTDIVTIPSGAYPVVTSTASIGGLTIASGATLTVNGTFAVRGDLINNGSITGSGNLIFNGSSVQTISGGDISTNTIGINNSVSVTSSTIVSGYIYLYSTLTTNNNLTIDLDNGGIANSGSGVISGIVNVTKTFGGSYHLVSAPLQNMPAADFAGTLNSSPYFYDYNETVHTSTLADGYYDGWEAPGSGALQQAVGYLTDNHPSLQSSGNYVSNYTPTVTFSYTSTSPTPDALHDGWNLLGNPYPSFLDWDELANTLVNTAIYYYDASQSQYISYNAGVPANGGIIPSTQGIWVQTTATGQTVTFSNSARTTTNNPPASVHRTAAQTNILQLSVSSGSHSDNTYFRFDSSATSDFDGKLDARKWFNSDSTPTLYSQVGSTQYSINSLPYPAIGTIVPLKFVPAFYGQYTFNAANISSLNPSVDVSLQDLLLGTTQDLTTSPTYTFTASPADTTQRFNLVFRQSAITAVQNAATTPVVTVYPNPTTNNLTINTPEGGQAVVYNALGEAIATQTVQAGTTTISLGNAPTGVYTVIVTGQTNAYAPVKVIKN